MTKFRLATRHTLLMLSILALSACAVMTGKETTGEYIDDTTITAAIKQDLAQDNVLRAYEIHVETLQGVVQLSGFVDSQDQSRRAQRIASKVPGAKVVKNTLIVRPKKRAVISH